MKIKFVSLFLILAFVALTFISSESQAQKRSSTKTIKGQVISLNDLVLNGNGRVTKEQAQELANNGNPIVFLSNRTVYFVYNEDGSFAGKRLANFANNKTVGIVGITRKVNGLNIIIANMIESM